MRSYKNLFQAIDSSFQGRDIGEIFKERMNTYETFALPALKELLVLSDIIEF